MNFLNHTQWLTKCLDSLFCEIIQKKAHFQTASKPSKELSTFFKLRSKLYKFKIYGRCYTFIIQTLHLHILYHSSLPLDHTCGWRCKLRDDLLIPRGWCLEGSRKGGDVRGISDEYNKVHMMHKQLKGMKFKHKGK